MSYVVPRTRTVLSRIDWALAGQELLRSGGVTSVKLSALTRRLGVTSGSFYHHFESFEQYLDYLAEFYGGDSVDEVVAALREIAEPTERLLRMRTLAEELNIARLDSAMRVWATTNRRAADAVARLDDRLLELMTLSFGEMGFDDDEARVRATMAFAAGVGEPFLFGRAPRAEDAAAALEILFRGRGRSRTMQNFQQAAAREQA
jgi:AcrR family transcriptional regulator